MKLLIAADMEGITGVVNADHTTPGHPEYERFRRLMTADVNAAISGAVDGGADEVVVSDGHNTATNILIEELDARARLNSGSPSPFAMIQGIDQGVDAVFFIGYHARMGSQNGILDHTWSSVKVSGVWINGRPSGEVGLNAAVCGHYNAPVLMVSGDQTVCAEAVELLGSIETAVVKHASSRHAAELLPPIETHQRIQKAAQSAVSRYLTGQAPLPYRVTLPVEIILEFIYSDMADRAELLPGSTRVEARRIRWIGSDMREAYRAFRTAVSLASR
jgi:D-amino peptidase